MKTSNELIREILDDKSPLVAALGNCGGLVRQLAADLQLAKLSVDSLLSQLKCQHEQYVKERASTPVA